MVSSGDITFQYPINIIVQAFGTLTDQTSGHKWYFLGGSLCTFYSSASFVGVGTIFWTYTTLPASGSQGVSYTVGSTLQGPFTFGVLFDGTIQTFAKVTFIVGITGDFSASGTWLGGVIPTGSFCNEVGGCKLYISSGCTLSTASLNGQCDINFNEITVATGATFQLGSVGFVGGFRFLFPFTFNIHGTLNFLPTSGGSIYLPFGCGFNFFGGAIFTSSRAITIRIYDISVGGEGTVLINISGTFSGPYYVSISITGEVQESSERK